MIKLKAFIAYVFLCILIGCAHKNTAKIVCDPRSSVDYGSKVFFKGRSIGTVVGLEMDSQHCYAIISFQSEADLRELQAYQLQDDNAGRSVLVKDAHLEGKFDWSKY